MAKRKMSENSLKNLEKGNLANKTPSERKEIARKGAEKTNKIKKEKVAREEARNYIWNEIFGNGIIQDIIENGSTRDLIDLIKALLPPEKQVQEIIGDLTTKKVFVTPKELKETDAHIDSVIEG